MRLIIIIYDKIAETPIHSRPPLEAGSLCPSSRASVFEIPNPKKQVQISKVGGYRRVRVHNVCIYICVYKRLIRYDKIAETPIHPRPPLEAD
jgi:hypothetical protein